MNYMLTDLTMMFIQWWMKRSCYVYRWLMRGMNDELETINDDAMLVDDEWLQYSIYFVVGFQFRFYRFRISSNNSRYYDQYN